MNAVDVIYFLDRTGLSHIILPSILLLLLVFAVTSLIVRKKSLVLRMHPLLFALIIAVATPIIFSLPHLFGRYPPGLNPIIIISDSLFIPPYYGLIIILLSIVISIWAVIDRFRQETSVKQQKTK